jgi:hypothetical protein
MNNPNECVACDTGGKCPTGEKKTIRFCPACKWKLNQHAPKICPQCGVDLMALLWDEIDRLGRCNESIGRTDAEIINHLNAKIAELTRQAHNLTQERDDLLLLAARLREFREAVCREIYETTNGENSIVYLRLDIWKKIKSADQPTHGKSPLQCVMGELARLRAFRDAVYREIYENAGAQTAYAYIYQHRWDEIKAAEKGKGTP